MINYVRYLTGNHILNAAIISWALAQVLKIFTEFYRSKKIVWTRLIGAGGMPSSHTAFVVAMATSVGKVCSVYSPEFAIALCSTLVVMYDAAGVRRAAGEQAKVLNYMMDHWKNFSTTSPEMFENDLKELLGHTPLQVLMGAILGLGVGLIV